LGRQDITAERLRVMDNERLQTAVFLIVVFLVLFLLMSIL
jgi:hypothetical protein